MYTGYKTSFRRFGLATETVIRVSKLLAGRESDTSATSIKPCTQSSIQAYYNTILNTTRVFVTMTTVEALIDMPHRTRERVDVKFSKFYCTLKVIKQRVNDLREFAFTYETIS